MNNNEPVTPESLMEHSMKVIEKLEHGFYGDKEADDFRYAMLTGITGIIEAINALTLTIKMKGEVPKGQDTIARNLVCDHAESCTNKECAHWPYHMRTGEGCKEGMCLRVGEMVYCKGVK